MIWSNDSVKSIDKRISFFHTPSLSHTRSTLGKQRMSSSSGVDAAVIRAMENVQAEIFAMVESKNLQNNTRKASECDVDFVTKAKRCKVGQHK